ncbi:MAG: universal stress protein [Myxococcales bacterium]|nr:universal stress protein [Myxococcales bacterium]
MPAPTTRPVRRRPFEHVLVATDFSAGAARAVARTRYLPLAVAAQIAVLHVLPPRLAAKSATGMERSVRRELERAVATLSSSMAAEGRADIDVAEQVATGPAYVQIIRQARTLGADLVVVGRHGERPVKDLFLGSTAERVARAGDTPVLVVGRKAARPYRCLLVALDLGDTSRAVVEVALRALGPDVKAGRLVHAYHVPFERFFWASAPEEEVNAVRRKYRQAAAARLERLRTALGDEVVPWQTSILRGDPRAVVLGEARRRRADLLAVGTHGRSGLAHALLGSVAERLLETATCDVLVARTGRVSFELP